MTDLWLERITVVVLSNAQSQAAEDKNYECGKLVVEYQSVDDAKVGIEKYKNIAPEIFAEAQYLNVTMIAEDTAHFLAVYPNQRC